ncbi:MAG: CCA tRNA nucleotidyltransferase [Dehalococcoidia bacterium]|nr:CCA tRNA nucleotidyltransferase [Dehalococcoidia bacterium]
MTKKTNLSRLIKKNLSGEPVSVIKQVAELAASRNQVVYLVGGTVRDLLLSLPNFDLDLVVEGDAVTLARELAEQTGGKLTVHRRFGTAKLKLDDWSLDLATARRETYASPGALPEVKPGSIEDDLFRRDFTINAMAVALSPGSYGDLKDPFGGRVDLENKLVRVLHGRSFTDDATRVWRTIRYEQRLGFRVERHTRELMKRDLDCLETVSGDRIRHELELVLKENEPEKMLGRAWNLGVLERVHPALKGDDWLLSRFRQARETGSGQVSTVLYWALLTYRMSENELEALIRYLHPARQTTIVVRDTNQLKSRLGDLKEKTVRPAQVYSILDGYAHTALLANLIATRSVKAQKAINLYLEKLRFIKPALNGKDLQKLGITPGPRMQELLILLHHARLNGEITSRAEEVALVREYSTGKRRLSTEN